MNDQYSGRVKIAFYICVLKTLRVVFTKILDFQPKLLPRMVNLIHRF